LFDKRLGFGQEAFKPSRDKLRAWVKRERIPNAAKDGRPRVQFFEDYAMTAKRNSRRPMTRARYLCERKAALDPDRRQDPRILIDFANRNVTRLRIPDPAAQKLADLESRWTSAGGRSCSLSLGRGLG